MRFLSLILLPVLLSSGVYAQEIGNKNKPVKLSGINKATPPADIKSPGLSPPKTNPLDLPKPETDKPLADTEKPLDLTPKTYADPNKQYDKRMQGLTEKIITKPKKKQSLGTVKTTSEFVILKYRDSQDPDGDQIKISLNGNVVVRRLTLESGFNGIELRLETGYNYIDFLSLSEGTSGPNTAEYEVVDRDGNPITAALWDLGANETASLVVIREKK